MFGKMVTQRASTPSHLLLVIPVLRIPRTNSNKPENTYLFVEVELLWGWPFLTGK